MLRTVDTEQDAKTAQAIAKRALNIETQIRHQNDRYEVLSGNFTDPVEAVQFAQNARRRGYPNADTTALTRINDSSSHSKTDRTGT